MNAQVAALSSMSSSPSAASRQGAALPTLRVAVSTIAGSDITAEMDFAVAEAAVRCWQRAKAKVRECAGRQKLMKEIA